MIKHPVASTRHGATVYVDLINSPASSTISYQPHIVTLIKDLLSRTDLKAGESTVEFDFGHDIGSCEVVKTTEKDHIMYAKPINRPAFYRFVRRKQPDPTSFVTVIVRGDENGEYELLDTWFGRNMPAIPGAENETDQSRAFWATHAIILEGHPIQNKTLTLTCPY